MKPRSQFQSWRRMLRPMRREICTAPRVIGKLECPFCHQEWELTEQDNIHLNGGIISLPLHRHDTGLESFRNSRTTCPASEQLVKIQMNYA